MQGIFRFHTLVFVSTIAQQTLEKAPFPTFKQLIERIDIVK